MKKRFKKSQRFQDLKLIQNNGCIGCHSIDGTRVVGPTFKDIYNRETFIIKDGKKVKVLANEEYLKNAILNPKDEVVDTYSKYHAII